MERELLSTIWFWNNGFSVSHIEPDKFIVYHRRMGSDISIYATLHKDSGCNVHLISDGDLKNAIRLNEDNSFFLYVDDFINALKCHNWE